MWSTIITFVGELGIRILGAMNAKDEVKKSFIEWVRQYNEKFYARSSNNADEWDRLFKAASAQTSDNKK